MTENNKITPSQWRLFFIVLVIGFTGIVYTILRKHHLHNSAALYIGLPLILALGLSLTTKILGLSVTTKTKSAISKLIWFFIVIVLGLTGIVYTILLKNDVDLYAIDKTLLLKLLDFGLGFPALALGFLLILALIFSIAKKTSSPKGTAIKGIAIAVLSFAFIVYQSLILIRFATLGGISGGGISDSLYMGLTMILALGLSLTPKAESATGATIKGITIALLLSSVIFYEGYICIVFSAPIFYVIGAIIAYPIDRARKRKNKNITMQTAAIATIMGVLSLEGTTELTTIQRNNEVVASKVIMASIQDVRNKIAKTPEFGDNKPFFLRIFPYPAEISGQGLNAGDERKAKFIAYKHVWRTKVEGDLVLKISESTPNKIKFDIVKDDSYLSHYIKWQSSEVLLEALDENHTKVTWKLSYQRILDPAWYFSPMQYYAVSLAAEELIDHVATPNT